MWPVEHSARAPSVTLGELCSSTWTWSKTKNCFNTAELVSVFSAQVQKMLHYWGGGGLNSPLYFFIFSDICKLGVYPKFAEKSV